MSPDMTRLDPAQLRPIVADQRYPLVFATVSGAHLYGFPSRDSDVDLRGAHFLPAAEVVGLRQGPQTFSAMWTDNGQQVLGQAHPPDLNGIGHNVPQEAPQPFAEAIMEVDGY